LAFIDFGSRFARDRAETHTLFQKFRAFRALRFSAPLGLMLAHDQSSSPAGILRPALAGCWPLCVNPHHPLAFLRASLAGFGTLLAVLLVVLAALLSAGAARLGAHPADVPRKIRITAHEQRRRPAQGRAVPIQLNTTRHHLYVTFPKTLTCAPRAFIRAVVAGLDAIDVLLISHNTPFAAACGRPPPCALRRKSTSQVSTPAGEAKPHEALRVASN
jgi:hypothetical protein